MEDRPAERGSEEQDGVIDTGADEGKGGVEVEADHRPKMGDARDVEHDFHVFSGHDLAGQPVIEKSESKDDAAAVDQVIIQGLYFESGSTEIFGVRQGKYGELMSDGSESQAWNDQWGSFYGYKVGRDSDVEIPESLLGPALLEMRRVFADNERGKYEHNLRSGKVRGKVLGKRAWAGDDRLFQTKRLPGKKSYAVIIGVDISGSTIGVNLSLAKRAAMAQAHLLQRAGIKFAVYAHSGDVDYDNKFWLDMFEIKSFDAPWGAVEQEALSKLCAASANLDGHTLEFYRRLIEKRSETDKIIMYYSDGQMPAENYHEELEILQREIMTCKKKKITLLGVGIRTDSPRRHGLDTVEVHEDSDVIKVIRHLKNALVHTR